MRIIVIGDVHGREDWKSIVAKEGSCDGDNLYIFLGDYVSSHEEISAKQQLSTLFEVLEFKEKHPDKVILLRGNHDLQHMGYDWADCSGYFEEVEDTMSRPEVRDRYLKDTQWVYLYDNIIFSHAGITERWFKDSGCKTIEDINNLPPSELFGFRPCKMSDYYGISQTQGPTWVRFITLMDYALPGYIYVVGHTTVKKIVNLKEYADKEEVPNCPDIWVCDCDLREYLVIDDNKFEVKQLKEE